MPLSIFKLLLFGSLFILQSSVHMSGDIIDWIKSVDDEDLIDKILQDIANEKLRRKALDDFMANDGFEEFMRKNRPKIVDDVILHGAKLGCHRSQAIADKFNITS